LFNEKTRSRKSHDTVPLIVAYLPLSGEADKPVSGSRGKALFQRCANRTDNLPPLDFEEIEEEFERIHREMLAADTH
jgi:hypothetical protein